jgi:predicted house-cleaning noncanonical NTP pyrophosphatase (MazG superfamily)
MEGQVRERWQELCTQAAEEQDAAPLLELITEINRLLQYKEHRLNRERPNQHERQAAN